MFPQIAPCRPLVVTGNDATGGSREAFGDGLHAGGETVFATVADEDGQFRWRCLEPAVDAEFWSVQFGGARLPGIEASGPGDSIGCQPAARIGGDQAQAVDGAGVVGVQAKRQQAAERNAAEPDAAIVLAGRAEYLCMDSGKRIAGRDSVKTEIDGCD